MLNAAVAFESVLNLWETMCLESKWIIKTMLLPNSPARPDYKLCEEFTGDEGPWNQCREIRDAILHKRDMTPFFPLKDQLERGVFEDLGFTKSRLMIPDYLMEWCQNSRRIYNVSADLQFLLAQTSVEDYRFDEIPWPFRAMIFSFEVPLAVVEGEKMKHAIVVSSEDKPFSIMCFADKHMDALPDNFETKMNYLFSERRDTEILQELEKIRKKMEGKSFPLGGVILSAEDYHSKIGELKLSFNNTRDDDMFRQLIRIVTALPFYLKSLPKNSPHLSSPVKTWKIDKDIAAGLLITKQAEICNVTSSYKLDSTERKMLQQLGGGMITREIRAHFRAGHFRRPPGKGADPAAEKTVWVRPTLVHRDRVLPGTLPGGTEVILS